jgi:hypothetical protein
MKKNFPILFFALIFLIFSIFGFSLKVFAQGTAPTTINARILPTVWYSTLSVNDGDSIKIYAGIQNNSGIDFTGVAAFYVDDKEISSGPFSSTADSLKDVSANWVANPGDHNVQVKISTSLSSDKILVSSQSDKSAISITQKITPLTPEAVETTALNTASNIVSSANALANSLADKIDSFKKPAASDILSVLGVGKNNPAQTAPEKQKGSILGISTGPMASPAAPSNNPMNSVFNLCLDALAFLVRNWKWTLVGIIALFLLFKIIF